MRAALAARTGASLLALAVAFAACGDDASIRALEAFRALAAQEDLAYRMSGQTQTDGMSSAFEATVVGRDSVQTTSAGDEEVEIVYLGNTVFSRFGGEWSRGPRDPRQAEADVASLLRILAAGPLEAHGVVELDGRSLHRIVTRSPFPWQPGSEAGGFSVDISGLDLLIDDDGRPVRLLLQLDVETSGVAPSDAPSVLIDLQFTDVGAALTIEAPTIP